MLNKKFFSVILILSGFFTGHLYANEQELGDSKQLGLGENAPKQTAPQANPNEKISNYGRGVYVREYKDFGQDMVEVHPENGPSYYYPKEEIQQPVRDDGVYDSETPQWTLGEW